MYMLFFGQVEFNLAKAKPFSYLCKTQIFLSKILSRRTFSIQVHPSSFNLEKLGWGDSWIASKSCHSELSITGDTAKYLVLTLCRGGALFPQGLVNPFCHETHFASNGQVKTKMRPFRSIPSDQMDALPPINIFHPLSAWLEFLQLNWPRQSPYVLWLHWKLHDLNVSNLFAPGWPSTSEIHLVVQRFDDMTDNKYDILWRTFNDDVVKKCHIFH
jgi:hypothetical protein